MNYLKWLFLSAFILLISSPLAAQTNPKTAKNKVLEISSQLKSSPAFAEVILRKTELQSDLESLLIAYTEEFPKVRELQFEIGAVDKEIERLAAVKPAESSKLTVALGKLMVRKAELETDFWSLQKKYGDEHPEVKRARRKLEIYENAIREILF